MAHKDTLFVGCPFGVFHLDGHWEPNHRLLMTPDEQYARNISIGALPISKQSTSPLADAIQKGLVKYG